jgi:preprotein translocase subunit SecG
MLHGILMIVQGIASVAIVVLVLFQRGKGADAGAGFGAGASGTVFGARGATTVLSRATAVFATIFMLNSLALTYLTSHTKTTQRTLLDRAAEVQSAPKPAPLTNAPPVTTTAPTQSAPATKNP